MIRYGAHAFVWLGDWDTASGNDTIRRAAETGFDFLEVPLLRPDAFDARSHRRVLEEAGIGATVSLALPRAVHMPDNPEGAKRFLRGVFDHMEALGSTYLAGCIGYSLGALTGAPPTPEERGTIVETLQELAEDARARGITLALEACNRYETHLYNTLHDTREAVMAIGADNVQLHADTYHMNIEEDEPTSALVRAAAWLGHVQVSDSNRFQPGAGHLDWAVLLGTLDAVGYQGYLALECRLRGDPATAVAAVPGFLRRHDVTVMA